MSKYTEAAKEAQRRYNRLWRAKNREKVKEYNMRYWQKKAKQMTREAESNDDRR